MHNGLMPKVNIFFLGNDHYHTLHKLTKNCANWRRASCWFLCLKKSAITFGEGCTSWCCGICCCEESQKRWVWQRRASRYTTPNSRVHGANMGPIGGRQDPGGPHVGPMNFAIWGMTRGYGGMCVIFAFLPFYSDLVVSHFELMWRVN